jgi:hypothetical protein
MSETFVCKHCGVCCLTYPCKFAQVRYGAGRKKPCPALIKEDNLYRCILIEENAEVRGKLLTGHCEAPWHGGYIQPTQPDFSGLKAELIKRGYQCH